MIYKRVAVVGLGFMGGSLALALREKGVFVFGISRSAEKVKAAKERGIIDDGGTSLSDMAGIGISLLAAAVPVGAVGKVIRETDALGFDVVVTDLGSTKKEIVDFVAGENFKFVKYVGSHPMAGSHKSGLDAAVPFLYDGSLAFVVNDNVDGDLLESIVDFWKFLGVEVEILSAVEHDRLTAFISHVPHAAASVLVKALLADKGFVKYCGGGFKDTTRIAMSDPFMWADIFLSNRENVLSGLDNVKREIDIFSSVLKSGDKESLIEYLCDSKKTRELLK